MKLKHGLLAAVASVALIAGANGLYAQGGAGGGAGGGGGGDTQMQGGGKAGAQTPGGTPGGAQVQGQGGMQTQGSGKTQTGQTTQPGMDKPGQAQQRDMKRDSAQDRDMKRDSAQGGKESAGDKPVQLSDQQRTKISSSIRDTKNLKRVERTNINFNINVGTVVPRTIGLVALPAPIVAVVPAYRGFLYIVVGDELLIVHPRTYEIVAVIPA